MEQDICGCYRPAPSAAPPSPLREATCDEEALLDLPACEWMIREVGVAAVPGSSFFREPVNHLIRMHFARGTDVLDEAVRRMEKLTALLK